MNLSTDEIITLIFGLPLMCALLYSLNTSNISLKQKKQLNRISILLKLKYFLVSFENLDSRLNESCLETKITD